MPKGGIIDTVQSQTDEILGRNADELADDVATAGQPAFRAESPRVTDEVTDFLDEVNPARFDEALEEMVEASRDVLAKATDDVATLADDVAEEIQQQVDEIVGGVQRQADEVLGNRSLREPPARVIVENSSNKPPLNPSPLPDGTPPPVPISRFQTIEEAQAYIKENYPSIEVDFTGASPAKISAALDVLDDYARRYPNALQDIPLTNITTRKPMKMQDGAQLVSKFDTVSTEIRLNIDSYWGENQLPFVADNISWKYRTGRYSYDVTMRHELGHHLEKFIYNRSPESHQIIQDFMIEHKYILNDLSSSSATDVYLPEQRLAEFFAESFAAIRYTPASLSEDTIDYLRRFETLLNEVALKLDNFNPIGNIEIPRIPLELD